MLRFVEEDFGLSPLTQSDRTAASIAGSFDFKQAPLSPLILQPRQCPKSDYLVKSVLNGTVLRIGQRRGLHDIDIRSYSNILTLLFGSSYYIHDLQGDHLQLGDVSRGDLISAPGNADPSRALSYSVFGIIDRSIVPLRNVTAVLDTADLETSNFSATIGKQSVIVNVSSKTRVQLANGAVGTRADLLGGQQVRLSGYLDTASSTVVRLESVRILTGPPIHLSATVSRSEVTPGDRQTISIKGTARTAVTIVVRYPSGSAVTTRQTIGSSGGLTTSFNVPAGPNSYTSNTALVTVAAGSAHAAATFTIKRAPVEMYVGHGSVRVGESEQLRVVSHPRARVTLLILLPDAHYASETVTTDTHGRAAYNYRVPTVRSKSRTVTVQAIYQEPRATYSTFARFTIK
jgi:hypothetical protein